MNPDTYIAPVFSRFLDKAESHVKYIVSTSSYVRTLQKKMEVLTARKNDINGIIDEGERRSQRPNNGLITWRSQVVELLDRVDTAISKAHERGSCFCSICAKHKLGHSCDDMIKELDELLDQASSFSHYAEMVDCDASNTAVLMPCALPGSQQQYFAQSCKWIEDDNSNVNVIGIWGLGGVGKTTLLSKIHNHFVRTSSMFDIVIWTVASSEQSNIFKIQSEIVKKLKLKEDNDVQSQANIITRYLTNKNFLLFIDDLWKDVDLHKVGVPNLNVAYHCDKKRKVIFTTRSTIVCGNMEARKIIEVKCLDLTQSLTLFTQKVGEEVIRSDPAIPKLAEDITKECKGLPLALITIGRAMSTKLNVEDWKRILNLLQDSEGHNDLDIEEQLLYVLKISYDNLPTDRLKKCFLTISMWPEDMNINSWEIIDFWMGVDLIGNFESKHDAYQIGYSIIRRLQDICLLEHVEYDEMLCGNDKVRMHDVLRDMALWLVSDCGKNKNKWIVKAGIQMQKATNMKAKWREAECISLMHNKIKELPTGIPTCPSLLTLVLKNNELTSKSCFGKFHSLIHLDLSSNDRNTFPESICDLANLRYLNLSNNVITNLPMELQNLKMLRYLILRNNCITNIPRGVFCKLAELLVMDMFYAIDTSECPSVDVEDLKSIEENLLYFGTNVGSEEELSKLMLLSKLPIDDLCIEGLLSTTFHFMAVMKNSDGLRELHIQHCHGGLLEIVFDKKDNDKAFASLKLEVLYLGYLDSLKRVIWKDIEPKIVFAELRDLAIHECRCIEDITWIIYLPSLKNFGMAGCHSVKIAINNDVDAQVLTFSSLQIFSLARLDKLKKISIRTIAFPQLKQLRVESCPLLKSLPLKIETTPKLRKITGQQEWWEEVEWEDDSSWSHFNQFFRP